MSDRKMTRPGPNDDEFMLITCTPDGTAVEFFEFEEDAREASRLNVHPTTTTYLGRVIEQGEHRVRGRARHIAVMVEVGQGLRTALLQWSKGHPAMGRGRTGMVRAVRLAIDIALRGIVAAAADPAPVSMLSAATCETDGCHLPAAIGSSYCPPCRSIRSGHGL